MAPHFVLLFLLFFSGVVFSSSLTTELSNILDGKPIEEAVSFLENHFKKIKFIRELTAYSLPDAVVQISTKRSAGSGFFFEHENDVYVMTNKHMISVNGQNLPFQPQIDIFLPATSGRVADIHFHREKVTVKLNNKNVLWHKDAAVDLCGVRLKRSIVRNDSFIIISFNSSHIPNEYGHNIPPLSDVFMLGYPGFARENRPGPPIHRKGILARSLSADFNGTDIGLVDMGSFPGSSGSPLVVFEKTVALKNGKFHPDGGFTAEYEEVYNPRWMIGVLRSGFVQQTPISISNRPSGYYANDWAHLGEFEKSWKVLDLFRKKCEQSEKIYLQKTADNSLQCVVR